jgi:hypothetical protein
VEGEKEKDWKEEKGAMNANPQAINVNAFQNRIP